MNCSSFFSFDDWRSTIAILDNTHTPIMVSDQLRTKVLDSTFLGSHFGLVSGDYCETSWCLESSRSCFEIEPTLPYLNFAFMSVNITLSPNAYLKDTPQGTCRHIFAGYPKGATVPTNFNLVIFGSRFMENM